MRVAILVTHLLGTGHLKRASLIADGFAAAGHNALVLNGGMPAPQAAPRIAALTQLPPVRSADAAFSGLVTAEGSPADKALLVARHDAIEAALKAFAPDLLITELFPFGRRKLAAEFEAAVAAAPGAKIFASIRDILQRPRKPGRVEDAEDRLARLYDGAFVHGDDTLLPLSASWPVPEALTHKLYMTGYVDEAAPVPKTPGDGSGEIVAAAGGGPVGDRLFAAALEASAQSDRVWRLLVGGHDREARIAALRAEALSGANAVIEPVRPDFRALLGRCDLAVLQCGYNTAVDVMRTGTRTVFCPFEGAGETEQVMRAEAMAQRFGCGVIREGVLSGPALRRAAETALAAPWPDYRGIRLDGVKTTVALAEQVVMS